MECDGDALVSNTTAERAFATLRSTTDANEKIYLDVAGYRNLLRLMLASALARGPTTPPQHFAAEFEGDAAPRGSEHLIRVMYLAEVVGLLAQLCAHAINFALDDLCDNDVRLLVRAAASELGDTQQLYADAWPVDTERGATLLAAARAAPLPDAATRSNAIERVSQILCAGVYTHGTTIEAPYDTLFERTFARFYTDRLSDVSDAAEREPQEIHNVQQCIDAAMTRFERFAGWYAASVPAGSGDSVTTRESQHVLAKAIERIINHLSDHDECAVEYKEGEDATANARACQNCPGCRSLHVAWLLFGNVDVPMNVEMNGTRSARCALPRAERAAAIARFLTTPPL